MFIADEVLLDVSFSSARSKLASLARQGALFSTSLEAYTDGSAGATRVGAAGFSKLVRVQVCELADSPGSAGLAIRWEAIGPGGALFPVLDADITMAPADHDGTLLTLTGSYRPPLGALGAALDRALLHRVAAATVRNLITRLATDITGHNGAAEAAAAGLRPPAPPGVP